MSGRPSVRFRSSALVRFSQSFREEAVRLGVRLVTTAGRISGEPWRWVALVEHREAPFDLGRLYGRRGKNEGAIEFKLVWDEELS